MGEILANKLRLNKEIYGIRIGNIEYLLSQFADDLDLYLPFDQNVINTIFHTLTDIEASTRLKVSYEKTTLYRIGSLAGSEAKCYTERKVKWENCTVNMLGINIANDPQKLDQNFDSVIEKVEAVTKIWYYRSLTLMGKILVINTLTASLFSRAVKQLCSLNGKKIA